MVRFTAQMYGNFSYVVQHKQGFFLRKLRFFYDLVKMTINSHINSALYSF